MRTATVTIRPSSGWANTTIDSLARATDVTPICIHNHKQFLDGSIAVLYEFEGPPERFGEALADNESVRRFRVLSEREPSFVYIHFDPSDAVGHLLRSAEMEEVFIEPPMTFVDETALRVTVVGPGDAIRAVVDEISDDIDYTIERFEEYRPISSLLFSRLSERQREVLRLAAELGYYHEPREATQADIAEHLGCTAATVGEHLRRIEERLVDEIVPQPRRRDLADD